MNILMTTHSYPPYLRQSGVGIAVKNIVDVLSKNNDVFVIASKPPQKLCKSEKRIVRIPIKSVFHLKTGIFQFGYRSLRVAKTLLKKYDFDIFHDHEFVGTRIARYIKKEKPEIRTFEHSHSPLTGHLQSDRPLNPIGLIKKVLAKVNYEIFKPRFDWDKYIDEYISVSETHKKELRLQGINEGRISVVYNPIDTQKYSDRPEEKEKKVVFCGFLGPRKRPHWVIRAAKELIKERDMNVKFTLLGTGRLYRQLRNTISNYRLSNHVKLKGFVSEEDKIKEYQTSLLFTSPSTWESFGLSIAEAMSCSTPALSSNAWSMKEIVKHGKTGLRFETYDFQDYVDKMEYLLNNPQEAKKMGNKARRYVLENFSFPVVKQKLCRIYGEASKERS
ncbi:hypothetical protein AKJ65_04020 [candidate division MSBL1 archaeon SCGC-AAA259E19]|uniref:Uncharacterized protein n=1 Tax=candidate division MSBL1 archaeon SCGC-AAA259E19 TaxID=1698264 RepID=A0A133UK47_9EURY|nr:hypothetical protein AKJ65_04020 [candidate division MSBL1 archaeon SCGC-AAA259E19]